MPSPRRTNLAGLFLNTERFPWLAPPKLAYDAMPAEIAQSRAKQLDADQIDDLIETLRDKGLADADIDEFLKLIGLETSIGARPAAMDRRRVAADAALRRAPPSKSKNFEARWPDALRLAADAYPARPPLQASPSSADLAAFAKRFPDAGRIGRAR